MANRFKEYEGKAVRIYWAAGHDGMGFLEKTNFSHVYMRLGNNPAAWISAHMIDDLEALPEVESDFLPAYQSEVRPLSQDEGGGFMISYPDFNECISDGETVEEAIANGQDALKDTIAALEEKGLPVPEPLFTIKPLISIEEAHIDIIAQTSNKIIPQNFEESKPENFEVGIDLAAPDGDRTVYHEPISGRAIMAENEQAPILSDEERKFLIMSSRQLGYTERSVALMEKTYPGFTEAWNARNSQDDESSKFSESNGWRPLNLWSNEYLSNTANVVNKLFEPEIPVNNARDVDSLSIAMEVKSPACYVSSVYCGIPDKTINDALLYGQGFWAMDGSGETHHVSIEDVYVTPDKKAMVVKRDKNGCRPKKKPRLYLQEGQWLCHFGNGKGIFVKGIGDSAEAAYNAWKAKHDDMQERARVTRTAP